MNKYLVSTFAATFVLVLMVAFSACKFSVDDTKKEKTVVTALAYGRADNSEPEGAGWSRIVAEFETANSDIDIQYELFYDESYHQRVAARLAAGNTPDIAYMGADARWGKPWASANQQYDHRSVLDQSYYDLNLIPPMGPNGEIYEIPIGTANITTVLFMNETLVASLGFSRPETYADLVAMVPEAKKAGLRMITLDGADGWAWGSCLLSSIIARLSGDPNWVAKAVAGENHFNDQVFINALSGISLMVADKLLLPDVTSVNYGANIAEFNNGKALFMIQGQWVAGSIDASIAENVRMLAFPSLPGEALAAATTGSVAAAIQVGYGLTRSGAADPAVRAAALRFFKFYYSHKETTQRLRDGMIVAPILKNYTIPTDLPAIQKEKITLSWAAPITNVIDAYLSGPPNDALNVGMQQIANGTKTPAVVAAEVESLMNR